MHIFLSLFNASAIQHAITYLWGGSGSSVTPAIPLPLGLLCCCWRWGQLSAAGGGGGGSSAAAGGGGSAAATN